MSVGRLCQLFGVSRQAFHQREHYTQHAHSQSMLVLDLVVALRKEIPGLGTRKLYLLLQEPFAQSGIRIGRDKLHGLLQAHELTLRHKRSAPKTTNSAHGLQKYPNLLSDQLITAPQQVWVCDITYLCIGLSFGYLSLITDAYSKLIVGYCLHPMLTSEGCLRALEMALQQERPKATTLIHHSDRGSQYCSFLYIRRLREAGIAISMSQYGDSYENAIAERVNGILKTDFRLNQVFTSFQEAAGAVERSIHNYNHLRPHMSCDYLTPAAAHGKDRPLKKHWKPKRYNGPKEPTKSR